jgi:copper chaperone CopZ
VTVIFDGSRTDADAMKKALEKAGFPVEGAPVPIK